jgi:protein-S-isoprenylcysteine O-methyltransferase Ste14
VLRHHRGWFAGEPPAQAKANSGPTHSEWTNIFERVLGSSSPSICAPMISTYTSIAYAAWVLLCVVWIPGYFMMKRTLRTPVIRTQMVTTALIVLSFYLLFTPKHSGIHGSGATPISVALAIFGDILCITSILFAIWARLTLGRNWSGVVATVKDDHELVQSGPYAFVRHPIYTGFLFAMVGTALATGTIASYLAPMVGLVGFLLRIRIEEALMTAQFPNAYPEYKLRTKSLIPFFW